ncbi:MAG TPA: histidinol-phosphate transaminase [Bacillota bacterium]|nr:histidinol-phosphate transaminase [Bacillota bacterium]
MRREEFFFRDGLAALKPYVPGKPAEEVRREMGLTGRIVKLASNENPVGPSPRAVARMKEVLEEVNQYPDSGCFELREALSRKYLLPPDCFVFGNGVDNLIPLVVNTFVNYGDEVIVPVPSFAAYRTSAVVAGAVPVEVPLRDFRIDTDLIYKAVGPRTRIIFICNPNNPTGTIVPGEELDRLLAALPPGVVAVLDEAYYEYVNDASYPDSLKYLKEDRNVVILRTFSKIYGLAGLRLGYGMTRPDFVRQMDKIREPFAANRVVQAGAIEALADAEFVSRVRALNLEGREILYKGFEKLDIFYLPTEANFVFADLGADMDLLFPELLKRGVIVRPAGMWGYPTFARITTGTPEECRFFLERLEDALNFLKKS